MILIRKVSPRTFYRESSHGSTMVTMTLSLSRVRVLSGFPIEALSREIDSFPEGPQIISLVANCGALPSKIKKRPPYFTA